ncbi:MAG: hypothetical protein AAF298_22635 [Cyanobacteria bacterium P01_A01_bin.40]
MEKTRFVMYHKQSASARILFYTLNSSICHFEALPADSKIVESSIEEERVVKYPENLLPSIKKRFSISSNILKIETTFQAIAKNDDLTIAIYLINFTTVDPPREQLAHLGGKFISIIEARSLPSIEVELLGLAYSFLMD